jgi:formate hydrogenlyase subunit 3/multisubunit Na+/H+ antiporter MnhD subunit
MLGAAAVLGGSLHALLQKRVKMVIAYSTVAQLGYVFLVFPLAAAGPEVARLAWYGALYFAVSHACAKAGAFLAAGALIRANGHDQVARLAGAAERLPMVVFAFALAGVNLAGLPPSGGFIAKWMMLHAAIDAGLWSILLVLVVGSLLAAAYVFRIIERSLVSSDEVVPAPPLSRWLTWPTLLLALVPILLGVLSKFPLQLLYIGNPVGGLP